MHTSKGVAEIQVSHKLMPFLVELIQPIHYVFFARCNVIKSKWSHACTLAKMARY
jgi:hypothetical protein